MAFNSQVFKLQLVDRKNEPNLCDESRSILREKELFSRIEKLEEQNRNIAKSLAEKVFTVIKKLKEENRYLKSRLMEYDNNNDNDVD